ncbi:potassium channel family protein [Lentilactobacillus laojiaonis]|uniref:potassium channel family protein n=1 Tax=Lentilactobacillus laojiaonis TaxID=2883998 RepID=UPI001D0AD574|nr:potassium channel family protein [Lentilactobacillus laojiaonis]UDM32084.1 ion transporter [Lentilactobacillus laojiaonis]
MKKGSIKSFVNVYNFIVTTLIFISFLLVIASFKHWISVEHGIYFWILQIIWAFFLIDYVIRFWLAPFKKQFLIENSFDLLALIPFHPVFVFFRISRIIRIIRYYHLFWKLGWSGPITRSVHNFLYDTGFIYLFSISLGILLSCSLIYSFFEHQSLSHSLWWAITTATTVGYGDMSPKTDGGKIIASFLMIGGIGFIGLLTSTITDFFTDKDPHEVNQQKIDDLNEQVQQLSKQIEQLTKQIKNGNH